IRSISTETFASFTLSSLAPQMRRLHRLASPTNALQIHPCDSRRSSKELHIPSFLWKRIETGDAELRAEANPSRVGLQRGSQQANELRTNVSVVLAVDKIYRVRTVKVIQLIKSRGAVIGIEIPSPIRRTVLNATGEIHPDMPSAKEEKRSFFTTLAIAQVRHQ